MKRSSIISAIGILLALLGTVLVSCDESTHDPIGRETSNYLIDEYYTIASASAEVSVPATMWSVNITPQERVNIQNAPELYKSLAKEYGEDGTKVYQRTKPNCVPYDLRSIHVMSDGKDVSGDFDIFFESIKQGIKAGSDRIDAIETRVDLLSREDLKWFVRLLFVIKKRTKTMYDNLVVVVETTDGRSIVCELP